MRFWKVTPVHLSILEGLSNGKSIRKIAAFLEMNHSTIIRHCKQLEKRGFISRQVRSNQVFFSILPEGISIMHHPLRNPLTGKRNNAPPPDKVIRLHRRQIKFDLVNAVSNPEVISFKDHPSKIVHMGPRDAPTWDKNIIQFENFTAVLTTKSLIITGIQRYLKSSENIEVQEADVMAEVMPFAEQVEEKIRRIHKDFRLKRVDRGTLSGKIISREFAYEHHPIAETAKHMRIDADDGKPRIIVDQSKGYPELETVHKETSAEDMETLRKNTKILATNSLEDALKGLTMQVSVVTELTKHIATTQDQMDQVVAALGNITRIIGGMR